MVYNENIKQSIYNWREENRASYNACMRRGAKKYYENHKDEKNKKSLERYYFKKESERFRNILLE